MNKTERRITPLTIGENEQKKEKSTIVEDELRGSVKVKN
jgi:hypothetical protein